MPNNGIVVRLFLVDGDAQGLRTAEVMNWTGQIIVGSRSNLKSLGDRPESRKTGVYILVGRDPEDFTTNVVYVGESDNVYDRLKSHNGDPKKDFWESTILVTSKDENLTKTDVRYLESQLIDITTRANRAKLVNGTAPSAPPISEADMAVMDDFLERMSMVVSVLGYDFLRTVEVNRGVQADQDSQSPTFTLTSRGVQATAVETRGEFVVLEGSTASKQPASSMRRNVELRAKLVSDGILVDSEHPDHYVLTADTAFTSPSAAGGVISAQSINGRIAWKIEETGQTYADWQEERLR